MYKFTITGNTLFIINFEKRYINMKAFVDKEGCISCGICVNMCPDVFQFDEDEKSTVVMDPIADEALESAQAAADSCPVSVIAIDE